MTLPDPVRYWADRQPEAEALITPSSTWTWTELDARVDACARRLTSAFPLLVGVQATTQPDLVVLVLAALRAGRVLIPLSSRWPSSLRDRAMSRLEMETVITEDGNDVPSLADVTQSDDHRSKAGSLDPQQPYTVVHTSGSTGEPKAALHTVGNHVTSARGLIERFPLGPGDRWLLDLPLHHVGGLAVVMRCALAGATMALPPAEMTTADACRALKPTHASLVSTQLVRLLREDTRLESLRLVLLGGSAFPPGVLADAVERGLPIVTSYGMTEMTSTITSSSLPAERSGLATSGTVLPGRQLRVSEAGEIDVRGPMLFSGYLDAGYLRRPVDADGWFATGDRGEIDADGRLTVHGRIGNGFVSGGENIQPEAIEAALVAREDVAGAVVVSVPDAEFGARPVAFVQMVPGQPLDSLELAKALRVTLPGFMVPDAFLDWNGPSGLKPDRVALARIASSKRETDRT